MNEFKIGDIVKSEEVGGTFKVIGFEENDGVEFVQLKWVNPKDHFQSFKSVLTSHKDFLKVVKND